MPKPKDYRPQTRVWPKYPHYPPETDTRLKQFLEALRRDVWDLRNEVEAITGTGTGTDDQRLDEVLNPNTNKTFTMSNNYLKFTYQAPSANAFEIEAQGAYTGDLVHIHQHTGAPGSVNLLALEHAGTGVTPLLVSGPSSAQRLKVDAGGYVWVGADPGSSSWSAESILRVMNNIQAFHVDDVELILETRYGSSNPSIHFQIARGTAATPSVVSSGDYVGGFSGHAHNGTTFVQGCFFGIKTDGTPSTNVPMSMEFWTRAATGAMAKRFEILATGDAVFGSTTSLEWGGGAAIASSDDIFSLPITNNTWITWDKAGTGTGDILVCDTADNVRLNAPGATDEIHFEINKVDKLTIHPTNGIEMSLQTSITNANLRMSTAYKIVDVNDADHFLSLRPAADQLLLASAGNLIFQIDSDNSGTTNYFEVRHNATTYSGGTRLARIDDEGRLLMSGALTPQDARQMVLAQAPGNTDTWLGLIPGGTGVNSEIHFYETSFATANIRGRVRYETNNERMEFWANALEKAYINNTEFAIADDLRFTNTGTASIEKETTMLVEIPATNQWVFNKSCEVHLGTASQDSAPGGINLARHCLWEDQFGWGEAITKGYVVYLGTNSKWYNCQADTDLDGNPPIMIGVAMETKTGTGTSIKVALYGEFRYDSGYNFTGTRGEALFVPTADGVPTPTAPTASGTVVQVVGFMVNADAIYVNPQYIGENN